ncbi:MAG: C1 family peptidase [Gammaproteobacteria bacterium]
MNRNFLLGISLTAAVVASTAQALEVGGSVVSSAVVTKYNPTLSATAVPTNKPVYLMQVKLTDQQRKMLQDYQPNQTKLNLTADDNLPSKVQLGMNGVPVLDQGRHGTCVTFANTAAIDAVLGKGDHVSQLCSLELASYFANNGYLYSGWEGTWGPYVLNQFMQFGYISKDDQKSKSCSGVNEYPRDSAFDTGKPMNVEDYKSMSVNLNNKITWQPIMNHEQRFDSQSVVPFNANEVLKAVKLAILSETTSKVTSRVTFGVILPVDYCSAGACARLHATNDTWALTDEIARNTGRTGGHEMVITGYDDNAVAVDQTGKKHKGLLTLRNSWGDDVADKGNYYMSYDFFKKFVLEAQQIKLDSNH